jgi:hypothetical protein
MIEIQDGFGHYQQNGGVLSLRDYGRIKNGSEGLSWSVRSSSSQVERMAKNCGLELTEDQIDLYAVLREIEEDEVERDENGRSIRGLSDQAILAEVLLLTGDEEGLGKVKGFYKNIFEKH